MTQPERNLDQPVGLKEYTYSVDGIEHTAQLSEADAKRLGATESGGEVELATPIRVKPSIEDTTPGYGTTNSKGQTATQTATQDAAGTGEKAAVAPANKARTAPTSK